MDTFIKLCHTNNIAEIKAILDKDKDTMDKDTLDKDTIDKDTMDKDTLDISYNNYEIITICCENNYFDLFRELYPLIKNCSITIPTMFCDEYPDENLLCYCCRYNFFYIVQIILEIDDGLDIEYKEYEAICLTCQEGSYQLYKLLSEKITIDHYDIHNFLLSATNITFIGDYGEKCKIIYELVDVSQNKKDTVLYIYNNICKELINKIDLTKYIDNYIHIFKEICIASELYVAEFFINNFIEVHKYINSKDCDIITDCCRYGNIDIIDLLISSVADINIPNIGLLLNICFVENKLELLKTIIDKYSYSEFTNKIYDNDFDTDIDIDIDNDQIYTAYMGFGTACNKGYLEIAKWLYAIVPDINLLYNEQIYFKCAIESGHKELTEWLYDKESNFTMTNDIFLSVCDNCELEMIDWVLDKKMDIDISYKNYMFFYNCIYNIFVNEDDCIKLLTKLFEIYDKQIYDKQIMDIDDDIYNIIFTNYCTIYLGVAIWIYDKYKDNINLSYNNEYPFKNAYLNNNVDIMTWLLETKPDINIMYDVTDVYNYMNSVLKIRWYLKHFPNFDITLNNYYLLYNNHANIDILKLLYEIQPDINLSMGNEYCFRMACKYGDLNLANWLYKTKPNINVSILNDYCFRKACKYNCNIDLLNWLLKIKPDINISAVNEYAFRGACSYGSINIINYLLTIKKDINIEINNHISFRTVCNNYNLDIAELLVTLRPTIYEIISTENNEIQYKILVPVELSGVITNTGEEEICCICYDRICNIITDCGHKYCLECISKWYNKNINPFCPYCKNDDIKLYKYVLLKE